MKRLFAGLVLLALAALVLGPAQAQERSWKFLIYGDTRTQDSVHTALVERMTTERADLVFNTGDMVSRGLHPEQWRTFFEIIAPLRAVSQYYPVRGNHDFGMNFLDNYEMTREGLGHFDVPVPRPGVYYYSIRHKNAKFIVLDPFLRTDPASLQGTWLKGELEAAKDVPFVFVLFHYPIFNAHPRRPDNERLKQELHPVLRDYAVSAVFNGHDHYYYRTRREGVLYVISGGGGAPLYDFDSNRVGPEDVAKREHHYVRCIVHSDRVEAEVINLDGQVIDRFTIAARK